MNKIYKYLLDYLDKNIPLAIAIIIETRGSTPQVQGATAIFSTDGLLYGTLGGGILEADAQERSVHAIREKSSQMYEFDLDAGISSDEGALCGGKAIILIDATPEKSITVLREMNISFTNRQPGVLATFISKYVDGKVVISWKWIKKNIIDDPGLTPDYSEYNDTFKKCLDRDQLFYLQIEDRSRFEDAPENKLFLKPLFPMPGLIIAGAGHIGQAVAHLGSLLEFEVTIIDDRPEYCNRERIPDADHVIVEDIGKAFHDIPAAPDNYIVIVTRGHKNDADALRECINSEAAYIGMIGSKRKVRQMREKFLGEGWATPSRFDQVYAPIGVDIQSKTVQEIAISICAQLVLVRNQKQKKKNNVSINAIILAAGESRRMGQPKLLMPFGEATVIDTVIGEIIRSGVNDIIIVLGSEKDRIRNQVKDYPLIIVENPEYHDGMLSSIQCGLRALPDNTDAILVLLGDQPMIPASVINDVINAYRQTKKGIIIAVHNGKRGHPILFDKKYKQEVEQFNSDQSLHDLTRRNPEDILEIEVGTPVILRDIDTIEDYNKELKYRRLT